MCGEKLAFWLLPAFADASSILCTTSLSAVATGFTSGAPLEAVAAIAKQRLDSSKLAMLRAQDNIRHTQSSLCCVVRSALGLPAVALGRRTRRRGLQFVNHPRAPMGVVDCSLCN